MNRLALLIFAPVARSRRFLLRVENGSAVSLGILIGACHGGVIINVNFDNTIHTLEAAATC
jgi:hypothetical protein